MFGVNQFACSNPRYSHKGEHTHRGREAREQDTTVRENQRQGSDCWRDMGFFIHFLPSPLTPVLIIKSLLLLLFTDIGNHSETRTRNPVTEGRKKAAKSGVQILYYSLLLPSLCVPVSCSADALPCKRAMGCAAISLCCCLQERNSISSDPSLFFNKTLHELWDMGGQKSCRLIC